MIRKCIILPSGVRFQKCKPNEMILLENLQEMTSCMVFIEMNICRDDDLVFKGHLQGPIVHRCQGGKIG